MGLYDLSTGAASGGGGFFSPETPPAPTVAQTKKPSGGLFGLGFGPNVNLGVGDLAMMIPHAIGGLMGLAGGAIGDTATGNWSGLASLGSQAGHGLASGLLSVAEDIPGVAPALRNTGAGTAMTNVLTGGSDVLKPRPIWERIQRGEGILPAVTGDVGQVALAATGVGAAAGAGIKIAEGLGLSAATEAGAGLAGTAAEAAGGDVLATEAAQGTSLVDRLQSIKDAAHQVAHPYRYIGREYLSPFTRAAAEASGEPGVVSEALQRRAAEEAAARPEYGPPDTRPAYGPFERPVFGPANPLPAEDILKGRYKVAEPTIPTAGELPPEGNAPIGPVQQRALDRNLAPISPQIKAFVDSLPSPLQSALAGAERFIQGRELRGVVREQALLADTAIKKVMSSPEVQQLYEGARAHLVGQVLEDGTTVTPQIADQLLGDAIRQRGTGVEDVLNQLRERGALPGADWLAKQGITGRYSIPPGWLTTNPALNDIVNQGVQTTQSLAKQQLDIMRGGRLGNTGLERVGLDEPLMTDGEQRALKAAQRELQRAADVEQRATNSRAQAAVQGARLADREGRLVTSEDAARAAGDARDTFHPTQSPALFRSQAWGPVLRQFVSGLAAPDDGASLSPFKGRLLEVGGQDHGWSVSVRELPQAGFEATNGRVPLAEWNRVTNPLTGATRGEEIMAGVARDYQKALANRDMNLGLWVDESGNVSIDISQNTINGAAISRQQARSLGAFRAQDAVFDMDSGTSLKPTADPAIATHFLDAHAGRDATSRAMDALVAREAEAAKVNNRLPAVTAEETDAAMDAMDHMAIYLSSTRPDAFPTADAAYRAVKTTLGKDPSRLPGEALLHSLLPEPGGIGRSWWEAAKARFPNWEPLAAWYDRSHTAIENEFRDKTITLLDGTQHSMADVMYDLIATSSISAEPAQNLRNALNAAGNLKGVLGEFQAGMAEARKMIEEFQTHGFQGPLFERFAGDYAKPAMDQLTAEHSARGEVFDPASKAGQALLTERKQALLAADPAIVGKMHMYSEAYRRMMPVLMGRPLDTWDPEFLAKTLPEFTLNNPKKLDVEVALQSAERRARDTGVTLDEYIADRGTHRAAALAAEKGDAAPKSFSPEDIQRLGRDQIVREHYAGEALAKLRSYRENLASPATSDAVTLDRWMNRLFGENTSVAGGKYGTWADELRATAQGLRAEGVTVEGQPVLAHHVQALLWAYSMDEWNRIAGLAKENGFKLPGKLDKYLERGREFLRERGVDPDQPRRPDQPLPKGQSFEEVMADPETRQFMDDLALHEGFKGIGDQIMSGFKADLAAHPLFTGALHDTGAGGVIKGATWAQDATHMMVRYFQTADPTTLLHENAHVFRALMSPEDSALLERAYGVTAGNWTRAQEEAFGEDWTRMLSGRAAQSYSATPAIQRLQNLVSQSWQILKERLPGGHRVPQETADMFDRVYGPTAQRSGSVTEAKVQSRLDRAETANANADTALAARDARNTTVRANLEGAQRDLQARLQRIAGQETLVAGSREKAVRAMQRIRDAQDNPSLSRTPPQFQPIWHAYSSLVGLAADSGDLHLANALMDMGDGLGDLIEHAKANGFDPSYIPKMTEKQVMSVVFQGMRLVRDTATESDASARHTRLYAHPEFMDRSIAGLAGGMIDATHEMHANAVTQYVEDVFAHPIPEDGVLPKGWVPWSDTKQYVLTGKAPEGGIRVGTGSGLMIPEAMDRTLRSFGQNHDTPIFRGIRMITNPWRAMTLAMSPAWYAHVIVGHAIMTFAAGARLGDWADAWRAWREGQVEGQLTSHFTPETVGATRGRVASDISEEAGQATGMATTLRERMASKDTVAGKLGVIPARLSRAVMMTDEIGRVATYLAGKRAGMTDLEALSKVHRFLVDYGDLSPFEQQFVRSVVPFYAFQKGVLKVAARYQFDNPAIMGIMMNLGDLNKQLQQDRYGAQLPDQYGLVTKLPFVGNVNLAPFTSFADSEKLLTTDGIASAVNPFVKFGLGQIFGAQGMGTQYHITPTGAKIEVPRPASLITDILPKTGAAQLPGRVLGGQFAAALGATPYSDARLQTAAATLLRSQGALQGLSSQQILQLVQQAGLPPTAAQQRATTARATQGLFGGTAMAGSGMFTTPRGTGGSAIRRPSARAVARGRQSSRTARAPGLSRLRRPRRPR